MKRIFYGLLMGSGFGIVFSSAFVQTETDVRIFGIALGFILYTFGVIKLRNAKRKA